MLMYIILHNYLHTCDKYRNEIFDFDISIIKDTKGILYELLVRKNRTIRTTIGKFIDNKL